MRFSFAALTVLGAVASASASLFARQAGLPACASPCLAKADFSGCQPTDNLCLCKSTKFVQSTTTCIQGACSGADLAAAQSAAQSLCAAVGVTLSATTPAATAAATTAASTTAKTAATTSAAASAKPNAASLNNVDTLAGIAAFGIAALAL